ncbi:MAG TPA: c-type cytochrome [Thermoanaerobaculia bacterium]|jgi:mono/diheme cytochrome c family protein
MTRLAWTLVGLCLALLVFCIAGIVHRGIGTRDEPTAAEALAARALRRLAMPRRARGLKNPTPGSENAVAIGRAHFADHCASCHGNDGKGQTAMGRNFYPRAPDMTLEATQSLSDGEIYWIIENGIRLTGMPAWGKGGEQDEDTWALVSFIRHLPRVTEREIQEMKRLNPKSAADLEEESAAEAFLRGDAPASTPTASSHHPSH